MSDSLENMAEMQNEVTQPDNVVATESEEINQPQVNNEDTELYIDTEGDQTEDKPKNNMTEAQLYAAWQKDKKAKRQRTEELEEARKREEEKDRRIAELEDAVGKITKGAPPTLESCDYDEQLFAQKMKEYYAPSQQEQKATAEVSQPQSSNSANDMAEFYLYQKEQELAKQLPDYEQNKAELVEKFKQFGGNEQTMMHLAGIASQANVDIAKANVALNKVPGLLMELNQAAATGNQFAIAEVLKKAASKVQTRQRKPIDTQPEPTINSSGPIDNAAKAIEKAKTKWMESGSIADYNAYKQLKKTATK